MKYAWIKQHNGEFTVETMCQLMRASRSAYDTWLQRPETTGEKEDAELNELIKTAFAKRACHLWDSPP